MIQRIPRWARWLLVVLAVLLAIYLVLYAVLTSTAFSRFVLNQVESAVPQLTFSEVEGSFTQGLRFDLSYVSEGAEVQASETRVVIVPDCLWQLNLCIDNLEVQRLLVSLPPEQATEEPAAAPGAADAAVELPEITLPVDLRVKSLGIASLLISRGGEELYQLQSLDSALAWRNGTLELERLTGRDAYCQWAITGEITFINQYPLNAEVGCQSEAGYGEVEADISGDLAQLTAEVQALATTEYTAEPAPVQVSLTLAPLRENLPAQLRLQTDETIRLQLAEQSAQLESSLITAEGPLLSPTIEARLNFESPFWPGGNALLLSAAASTEALTIQSLSLQLPEGQVDAQGQLSFGEALAWEGGLSWQNVDLSQFGEGFTGQLNGQLTSEARQVDGEWRAHVALQSVDGTWLERKLSASGELDWQDSTLAVQDLQIQQGENRVTVAGSFAPEQQLDMAINLRVPNLGHLIPDTIAPQAGGEIRGQIRLAGTLDNLSINSHLNATDLRYNDIRLASGELNLRWFGISERRGNLALTLNDLTLAENLAADVSVQGQGNVDQHTVELQITGLREQIDRDLALQCSGGFADAQLPTPLAHWQGRCTELKVALSLAEQPQTWTLASPVALEAHPRQPAVTLAPFCLQNEGASLCSSETIRFADGQLSDLLVTGSDLPVAWIEPLLPGEDVNAEGTLGIRFSAAQLLENPLLSARVSSDDLGLRWTPQGQQAIELQVTDLAANWQLLEEKHEISWDLKTKASGSTRGQMTLQDQQIAGDLVINELQLGTYTRLLLTGPDQTLTGEVNAGLEVAGTLQEPVLSGEVIVDDGTFNTEQLPVPLRDIYLNLEILGNRAVAQGTFNAAESKGDISGQFTWGEQTWAGELNVSAQPLQVQPEPDVQLSVAPDLKFNFAPGELGITGQVRVPQAQIELTELPEQAVGVSADTVVIGPEDEVVEAEAGTALNINTNIELVLGDKVQFEGFGLETRITGKLRLQQESGGRLKANGKLQLVEGRYEAYGQNLVIRSGDLVFVGDIDNPQLRLEAVRGDTPEDVVVGLRASGPARTPRISLFSRPDMPQQAQLSYLLTGNPPGTKVETDPQLAAAEAALSYALEAGSGITQRAGEALGIEELQVTAGSTEDGTQIGLSGYITPNLLVRYGVGVFDAINTLTVRYQVGKNLYLEAMSGEGSDVGVMWSFERN
ncbi:hypothetical protein F6455_11800 [Proteobacteria bacterium 005FR1]|nr:hypothetical protein [Proteobacteria bacterium 005FR1]